MPYCECLQSLLERNVGTRNVGDPQPLVAEFWSETDCAGLLSGVMDNAKKYISAGDLEPDQDKGSDTHKKTVTGDTVGDPLNGHIWPCFVKYEVHCDLQHRVWVSHCCASNPNEVHFECGLRELLVFFQCLAFSV